MCLSRLAMYGNAGLSSDSLSEGNVAALGYEGGGRVRGPPAGVAVVGGGGDRQGERRSATPN